MLVFCPLVGVIILEDHRKAIFLLTILKKVKSPLGSYHIKKTICEVVKASL